MAPHYHAKVLRGMSNTFSILLDESNDKVDKSCIILIRVLDEELGYVKTRFLDMPVINIGTAANIFRALKESLQKFNLDFSKAIAFMSDTANVAGSVVQKLIKNGNPSLYDVGYICHLADLCIKAGMKTLPIDIDQLFIGITTIFITVVNEINMFGIPSMSLSLKFCPTRLLSLLLYREVPGTT